METTEKTIYTVPGMSCGHCRTAIEDEVAQVPGVEAVEVNLDTKYVTVTGRDFKDDAVRAAIDEAGYEVV